MTRKIRRRSTEISSVCITVQDVLEHTITIKFIKDGTIDQNNDSLQFRIRFE